MAKAYWIAFYRAVHDPEALAAYDSPEYAEALRVLGNAVDRDLRIVEGVD